MEGALREGVTATDFVCSQSRRCCVKKGVVGKFVEFFGRGLSRTALWSPIATTIGNMSPEFGSTVAIFPIDRPDARHYLRLTGANAANTSENW